MSSFISNQGAQLHQQHGYHNDQPVQQAWQMPVYDLASNPGPSSTWYDRTRPSSASNSNFGSTSAYTGRQMGLYLAKKDGNNFVFGSDDNNGYSMKPGMCQKNLIVNYLPQNFTDRELFRLFTRYGPIHSVKIMKENKSGYSYGFGFVNFILEEDAEKAMKGLNGYQIGNKRLKVSVARPPSEDIKDTNVFITNLPRHYTEDDLIQLFGHFGEIVQRHILRDKDDDALSRGCGFVRFDLREQASKAISSMNGFIPEGSDTPIRVKLAQDHGKQKAAYLAGYQDACLRRQKPPPSASKVYIDKTKTY